MCQCLLTPRKDTVIAGNRIILCTTVSTEGCAISSSGQTPLRTQACQREEKSHSHRICSLPYGGRARTRKRSPRINKESSQTCAYPTKPENALLERTPSGGARWNMNDMWLQYQESVCLSFFFVTSCEIPDNERRSTPLRRSKGNFMTIPLMVGMSNS